MKCSNCGAELSDDTKFCSYCGKRIDETVSASGTAQKMQNLFESIANESERANAEKTNAKKSMADKIKQKGVDAWNKLSIYGKITAIAITVFAFLCIIAFLFGKTFAAIITILQIVLTVIALLMKKQIIKVPKNWLYIITLTFAIILLIPYVHLFESDYENIKRFKWSDIVLSDTVPETKSRSGEILINSMDHLSLDVYGINQNQYNDYIEDCKERGFIVDAEQLETSFAAYNDSGYKLSLYYYTSDNTMHIGLDAAYQYGAIVWSDDSLATMIPVPKSVVGEISKDDETGFLAYVANTPIDDFKSYIALCVDKGFVIDSHDAEKAYSAKNSEGYRLSVEYQGNNVICIAVDEPEYEVTIEVECVANWIFSKYDVDIYVDGSQEGTIAHGTSESFVVTLTKGIYEIKFVNAEDDDVTGGASIDVQKDEVMKYKISCSSTKINVENIAESYEDNSENQPAEDVENKSTESRVENDESSENELIQDDENTMEYVDMLEKVENQLYTDVRDMMEELGYTAEYEHEYTHLDFTGELTAYADDELNSAGFIITGIKTMDTAKKTIILYVNTNENIERIENQKESNITTQKDSHYDADAEKLDKYDAWIAVEDYGKMMYSKFKLHYMTGELSAEQVDDNTWNLKAYCDVDDGNGTKKNCNCEATVEGTNLNPVVTYFKVY